MKYSDFIIDLNDIYGLIQLIHFYKELGIK